MPGLRALPAWAWVSALLVCTCVRRERAPPPPAPKPGTTAAVPDAVIYVTADLRGYLVPCGCSANMRGGMDRAAAQVQAAREAGLPVVVADSGDALFPRPSLEPAELPQEERKARVLGKIMQQLGFTAKAVGPLDETRGKAFLGSLSLPLLANGNGTAVSAGGYKVGFAAGSSLQELTLASSKAHNLGALFVVGFWTGTLADAQRLVETRATGVDVLVSSHAEGDVEGEANVLTRAAVPLVRPESKGRSLVRMEVYGQEPNRPFTLLKTDADIEREMAALTQRIELLNKELREPGLLDAKKQLLLAKVAEVADRRARLTATPAAVPERSNSVAVAFIPLESTLPTDPAVSALITDYDREVGLANLAWAREHGKDCAPPAKGEASYLGNEACRACHAAAFEVYDQTRHAHAYQALEKAGKQYRVDCIVCHVTGYEQPGGVCRVDQVAGRDQVGCETCHGPGSLHVASKRHGFIRAQPTERTCRGCHNPENSPGFNFGLYLPKVLGKGHAHRVTGS